MRKVIVFLVIFCHSFIATASSEQQNIDQFIASFINCDSTFFSRITEHKNELQKYAIIQSIDEHRAYIAVDDRTKTNHNFSLFSQPISYKSLSITGYYDSAMNLTKYGDYYFWGFMINNDIDEITGVLDSLIWKKIEENYLYIANPKIRYADDSLDTWHDNENTFVGVKTMPAQGTAEKLLLLEKSPDMTLLVCSIQGFLPPELLELERPDIVAKQ